MEGRNNLGAKVRLLKVVAKFDFVLYGKIAKATGQFNCSSDYRFSRVIKLRAGIGIVRRSWRWSSHLYIERNLEGSLPLSVFQKKNKKKYAYTKEWKRRMKKNCAIELAGKRARTRNLTRGATYCNCIDDLTKIIKIP